MAGDVMRSVPRMLSLGETLEEKRVEGSVVLGDGSRGA